MAKHKHRWRVSAITGYSTLDFRCGCGEKRSRAQTAVETETIKKWNMENIERSMRLHTLDRSLVDLIHKFKEDGDYESYYDLMVLVRAWAEDHESDGVRMVSCDDDAHMGAFLLFVPHKAEDEYWGTSVRLFTQRAEPVSFFLYPGHMDKLSFASRQFSRQHKALDKRRSNPWPRFSWTPKESP